MDGSPPDSSPPEIPDCVPEITDEMIHIIHTEHVPAFFLMLLHSIHRPEGCGTSLFQRESSRQFHLDEVVHVKLELLLEFLFHMTSLE